MNPFQFHKISFSDPHVRIVGEKSDVLKAKELVLTCLDSRVSDTITLKRILKSI